MSLIFDTSPFRSTYPMAKTLLLLIMIGLISCGGDGDSDILANNDQDEQPENPVTPDPPITPELFFTVGGTVTGLRGTSLLLQNNNGDDLTLSNDGSFRFNTALTDGAVYDIRLIASDNLPNRSCNLSNNSGSINGADITNITINCVVTPLAFPGAAGAGAYANGGRGGKVVHITTTEWSDDLSYDPVTDTYSGSLLAALKLDEPRYILFDIAGRFGAPFGVQLDFNEIGNGGNFTLVGHTAPGPVVISTDYFQLDNLNNAIIRYINVEARDTEDAVWISAGGMRSLPSEADAAATDRADNIVIDHVTCLYGGDECVSIAASQNRGVVDRVSVTRNLIAASSKGMIVGSYTGSTTATVAYNLFVDVPTRHPNPVAYNEGQIDMVGNVVENYGDRLWRVTGDGKFNSLNYYVQPNRVDYGRFRIQYQESAPLLMHSSGAVIEGVKDDPLTSDWDFISAFAASSIPEYSPIPESSRRDTAFDLVGAPYSMLTALETKASVIADAGNNKGLDAIGQVYERRYTVNDFYLDLAANPVATAEARRYAAEPTPAIASGTAFVDSDRDGMPDDYESSAGLDPSVNDANGDIDDDGYTNLENFLWRVDKP